jgi:hypothetical protein
MAEQIPCGKAEERRWGAVPARIDVIEESRSDPVRDCDRKPRLMCIGDCGASHP